MRYISMRINSNKSILPRNGTANISVSVDSDFLEDMQAQINEVNRKAIENATSIENMETQVNTGSITATGAISGASASLGGLNVTGNVSADSVNVSEMSSGEATIGELNATEADIATINSTSINGTTVTADTVNATRLNINALEIEGATIENIDGNSVTASTGDIDNINAETVETRTINVAEIVNAKTLTGETVTTNSIKVSTKVDTKGIEAENAAIQAGNIDDVKALSVTLNEDTSQFLPIENDVFIKISENTATSVSLKLKDGNDIVIMTALVFSNELENGNPSISVKYTNNNSVESIFIDDAGNVWIKLKSGVIGSLYYFTTGLNDSIPETHSQQNVPFDITKSKEYVVATNKSGIVVCESNKIYIDTPDLEVKGNTVFDGDVYIRGTTTISGSSAERAKFLGNSDYVTADNDGVLVSKGANIDGNITAQQIEAAGVNVTGDLNVTGSITGTLDGNAETATLADKAIKDEGGNNISDTYAQKAELETYCTLNTAQSISGKKSFTAEGNPEFLSLADTPKYSSKLVGIENNTLVPVMSVPDYDAIVTTRDEFISALTDMSIKSILVIGNVSISGDVSIPREKVIYGFTNTKTGIKASINLSYGSLTQGFPSGAINYLRLNNLSVSNGNIDFEYMTLNNTDMNNVRFKAITAMESSSILNSSTYCATEELPFVITQALNSNINIYVGRAKHATFGSMSNCSVTLNYSEVTSSATEAPEMYCKITETFNNCNLVINYAARGYYSNKVIEATEMAEVFNGCSIDVKFNYTTNSSARYPKVLFDIKAGNGFGNIKKLVHDTTLKLSLSNLLVSLVDSKFVIFDVTSCSEIGFYNNDFHINTSSHGNFDPTKVYLFDSTDSTQDSWKNWISGFTNSMLRFYNDYFTPSKHATMVNGANISLYDFRWNVVKMERDGFSTLFNNVYALNSTSDTPGLDSFSSNRKSGTKLTTQLSVAGSSANNYCNTKIYIS